MAGEVKYGNILISSRKDETLTYAKYIKDLKSGKSVEEILEELKLSNPSISVDDLDSLNQIANIKSGQAVVYAVTQTDRNAGVLYLFSDSMSHVITQIFVTHCQWKDGNFNAHDDSKVHQYFRSYNNGAAHATWDKGTWSEWKPFVDSEIQDKISLMWQGLTNAFQAINAISAIGNSDIDNIWNNNI